jgi:hypothetical protein
MQAVLLCPNPHATFAIGAETRDLPIVRVFGHQRIRPFVTASLD